MKKRTIVILCGYVLYLIAVVILAGYEAAEHAPAGFFRGTFALLLYLYFLYSLPFATGILAVLDFGVSFLPSMRCSIVWRCVFGSFGALMLVLYADAFWVHNITEFHTHAGVALTLAVWICWILRLVQHFRNKKRQSV